MKFQLPILALALLFPIGSHAADQIAQTRAHYATVGKAVSKATVVKRKLQGYSQEDGELTAYFHKGVPLKMTVKFYDGSNRLIEEYYFWQGRLFFILRTTEIYESSIGNTGDPDIYSRLQSRSYFKDGKLWLWIKSDGKRVESGEELSDRQKSYLALTREMLAGARGKSKIIEASR